MNSVIGSYSSCGTYKKSTKKCDLSRSFSLKERICNLKYGDEENFRKVLNICTLLIWNLCFKLMCVFDIPSVLNNPFFTNSTVLPEREGSSTFWQNGPTVYR